MNTRIVSQDERVTAALAHGAALLPFWGIIASIVLWATQKEKSRFVAFHALQALVYQLLPVLGGFLFFMCYLCSFFAVFITLPATAVGVAGTEPGAGEAVVLLTTLASVGLPFLVFGLFILVWLVYLAYALIAAVRVFQGYDFRYAVVGAWLERHLEQERAVV